MAKKIIPEELNELIQQYLTDGVLTDKERQVILNEAENLGLNRDKIDLYLDAEIQKLDQQADAAVRRQKGRQCPYCGKPVPQLAEKCPHCGEDITVQASEELQEIFEKLEEALVDLKSGRKLEHSKATIERFARKAKMYYGSNPKVQKLLENIEAETVNAEKKVKSNIRKEFIFKLISKYKEGVIIACLLLVAYIFFSIPDWYEDYRKNHANESVKELTIKIDECFNAGNLDGTRDILTNYILPSEYSLEAYHIVDAQYYKVIEAYVKKEDYDSAESLAIVWRSRIDNDYTWEDSSCYKFLKSKFKALGRDFSALKSKYDHDDE